MNQINSCIFEGTIIQVATSQPGSGSSLVLEVKRTSKHNDKTIVYKTKIPCVVYPNEEDNLEARTGKRITDCLRDKDTVRIVGRMNSYEDENSVIILTCVAEHIDVEM